MIGGYFVKIRKEIVLNEISYKRDFFVKKCFLVRVSKKKKNRNVVGFYIR